MLISHFVSWDLTELPMSLLFSVSLIRAYTDFYTWGREEARHVSVCVQVLVCVCACGGQKSSVVVVLQELSTLFSDRVTH